MAPPGPPARLAAILSQLDEMSRLLVDARTVGEFSLEAVSNATQIRAGIRKDRETGGEKPSDAVVAALERAKSVLQQARLLGKKLEAAGAFASPSAAPSGDREVRLGGPMAASMAPLVCPDSVLLPYMWRRHMMTQAASSAADRVSLTLNAFNRQHRQTFPHRPTKRPRSPGDGPSFASPVKRIKAGESQGPLEGDTSWRMPGIASVVKKEGVHSPSLGEGPVKQNSENVDHRFGPLLVVLERVRKMVPEFSLSVFSRSSWADYALSLSGDPTQPVKASGKNSRSGSPLLMGTGSLSQQSGEGSGRQQSEPSLRGKTRMSIGGVGGSDSPQFGAVKLEPGEAMNGTKLEDGLGYGGEQDGKDGWDAPGVVEAVLPGVLRAAISLVPAGSARPDAVTVFAAHEEGSHVHPWGTSAHYTFRCISGQADHVLHQTMGSAALENFLVWLSSYRTLFSEPCSQCQRILAVHPPTASLLPPLIRPLSNALKTESPSSENILPPVNSGLCYHLLCAPLRS